MDTPQTVSLQRDVEAAMVPVGTVVTLKVGETAHITQALGGSYTVVVNGNMFRIEGRNADALGLAAQSGPSRQGANPRSPEEVEQEVWTQLKTCYDPEIPVNIVDLGLVYSVNVNAFADDTYRVDVKMTLTAPGCGMGPVIQQEAQSKILGIEEISEAEVELVWDPPWNQSMLSDTAKLELGLM